LKNLPDHDLCRNMKECRAEKNSLFVGAVWWRYANVSDEIKSLDESRRNLKRRGGKASFRLFYYPAGTLNVAAVEAELTILEQQSGFVADVVIIDYADIMGVEPDAKRMDYRNQINATWIALRRLSQVKQCAVITASQSNKASHNKSQIDQMDTTEDKRKLGHVTTMLALNQTPKEKRQSIMRISNILSREMDFDVGKNAVVLESRALGKPYIDSFLEVPDFIVARRQRKRRSD